MQESYVARASLQNSEPHDARANEFSHEIEPHSAPSFAELALRLELYVPQAVIAGRTYRSSLLVQNEGLQSISRISVREPLAGLETVTDAIPPARVHAKENFVERQIQLLDSGTSRGLELVWRPDTEGERTYQAFITVEAAAGATTEIVAPEDKTPTRPEGEPMEQPMHSVAPEPLPVRQPVTEEKPGLSFDVKNHPKATVNDLVEIQILVRNTGAVALHHVRVQAELPQELKHRQGTEVEYMVDELPIGGTELAVLRVLAESSGKAVCRLIASADEPVEAKSHAVVNVEPKPGPMERPRELPAQSPRRTVPLKPVPIATGPVPKHAAPAVPSKLNCCCQSQLTTIFEPWYGP